VFKPPETNTLQLERVLVGLSPVDFQLVVPPLDLWPAIQAELREGEVAAINPLADGGSADQPVPGLSVPALSGASANPVGRAGPVVPLRPAQRRSLRHLVSVAAAVMVIIGGLGVATSRFIAGRDSEPVVVAAAQLRFDPVSFDEFGSQAVAHVSAVNRQGGTTIRFDEAALPDLAEAGEQDADLELWLIRPDVDGNPIDLVSLGVIEGRRPGEFQVPESYDVDEFSVVDISVEPRDGNTAHSGRSILRGMLSAT